MIQEIYKVNYLIENLNELIDNSKFKRDYIISQLGFSRSTFYLKLKNKNFTLPEIMKIGEVLFPEEKEEYQKNLIIKAINKSLEEIKSNEIISHEDVIANAYKMIED